MLMYLLDSFNSFPLIHFREKIGREHTAIQKPNQTKLMGSSTKTGTRSTKENLNEKTDSVKDILMPLSQEERRSNLRTSFPFTRGELQGSKTIFALR